MEHFTRTAAVAMYATHLILIVLFICKHCGNIKRKTTVIIFIGTLYAVPEKRLLNA